MEVIEFLSPETLGLKGLGMERGLPEPVVPILTRRPGKNFVIARRHVVRTVIGQGPASELPRVGQRRLKEARQNNLSKTESIAITTELKAWEC